jgi:hypothetical protein
MPKAPILSREVFYDRLPDGTYRDLDWALVNTSVGACVEPRSYAGSQRDSSVVQDIFDASFNKRTEMDEDQMFTLLGTAGPQMPVDYNRDS